MTLQRDAGNYQVKFDSIFLNFTVFYTSLAIFKKMLFFTTFII